MLLEVRNLSMRYPGTFRETVSDVCFDVERGETLGLYGESGSGKSTIGQIVAGILKPTGGSVWFDGKKTTCPYRGELRRNIQMLFQHPEVTFDPRMTLAESMEEPYRFRHIPFKRDNLLSFLEKFGIYEEHLKRYPVALSGGELQRLALARIMLQQPKLIILDEPTSMLDVISQAQIINLLKKVREEDGVASLFISHDRLLCENFCDRIGLLLREKDTSSFAYQSVLR